MLEVYHYILALTQNTKLFISLYILYTLIEGSQLHVEEQGIIKHRLDRYGKRIGDGELTERGGTMKEHEVIAQAKQHGVKEEDSHNHNHDDDNNDDDNDNKDDTDNDKEKEECGSCYGAQEYEGQCCNTCEDIKVAYHKKGWGITNIGEFEQCKREGIDGTKEKEAMERGEGCNIAGYMQIKRSQGNFHIAPGYSFSGQHGSLHDFGAFQSGSFDTSHFIHHLSFGHELKDKTINSKYISYPLDDTEHKSSFDGSSIFQYYAKIVPTEYNKINGVKEVTNQYSVTMHETKLKLKEGYGIPGVYFFYEFSPLMVQISEKRTPFFHFITQVCAIIGGVFTVTGLLDRVGMFYFHYISATRIIIIIHTQFMEQSNNLKIIWESLDDIYYTQITIYFHFLT